MKTKSIVTGTGKRIAIRITEEQHKQIKVFAAVNRISIQDLLAKVIGDFLESDK